MWVEKTNSNTYKFSERFINPLTGKYNKVSVNLPKIVKYLPLFSIEQMMLIYRAFRQAIF